MRLGPERGHSRKVPPDMSAAEVACDQRSMPQDVTSSSANAEGSICQKRSRLSLTGRSPRDSPLHGTPPRQRDKSEHTSSFGGLEGLPLPLARVVVKRFR